MYRRQLLRILNSKYFFFEKNSKDLWKLMYLLNVSKIEVFNFFNK